MKLHITWLGQPKDIQTKFGVKQKNSLKCAEYGDKFLSFWVSPVTKDWKEGMEVEVLEVTDREYQGKTYYDIVMPKANHGGGAEVMKVLERIENDFAKFKLETRESFTNLANLITKGAYPTPEQEGLDEKNMGNFGGARLSDDPIVDKEIKAFHKGFDHTTEDANLDDLDTF